MDVFGKICLYQVVLDTPTSDSFDEWPKTFNYYVNGWYKFTSFEK